MVSFPNVDVLREVAPRLSSRREHLTAGLVVVVLALLCVGAARPHLRHMAPVENATVVLVVDTSRSMLSRDVAPTRLGAAKRAAQSFLDRVPGKLRVGLVTFAGDVTVAASPTHDRERLRRSVAAINRFQAGGGTAIGDALARAVELAREAFAEPGQAAAGHRCDPRRRGCSDDPVPLGRTPEPGADPGRGGRGAGGRRGNPRLHGGARHRPARPRGARRAAACSASVAPQTGRRSARSRARPAVSTSPLARPPRCRRRTGSWAPHLGRAERRTEVTSLFVAAAALGLAVAAGLSRVWAPGLP